MEKGDLLVLLCIAFVPYAAAGGMTGDIIATGEVTSSGLGMTISVTGPPALNLLSPLNRTYLITNVSLDYNVGTNDAIWYSLDGGNNISLTLGIRLYVEDGVHSLYLYANNSHGTSSRNVVFSVNSSKLIIFYDEYNDFEGGNSTNFYDIGYEDLEALEDIVLERLSYGKISFGEVINVIDDLDSSDNVVDLDSYIEISFNSISLNSVELPNFNKSATLFLYGLSFSNPRILIDGEVCPAALCDIVDYSGNILEFDVSHFSTYSAEETPEDDVIETPSRGGGGGGSGGESEVKNVDETFLGDREDLGVRVKQGRFATKKITLTNRGDSELDVDVRIDGLENIVMLDGMSFVLGPLESKEISIDFVAREDQVPGIYIGEMVIIGGDSEEHIMLSVVIESDTELFDINVNILENYIELSAGEDFVSEIVLFNFGETRKVDTKVEFFIKNSKGETILFEEEIMDIGLSLNFMKTFELPSDLPLGKYIFYVKATHDEHIIGSSAWFSVVESDALESPFWIINGGNIRDILITVAIIIIFLMIARKKLSKKISPAP